MNTLSSAIRSVWDFSKSKSASPWINVPRDVFADQLETRLRDPNLIDTSYLNLCGPGAFFHNMAGDCPELYARVGMELYDTGKTEFGGYKVQAKAEHLQARLNSNVDAVDWIMLATFRDSRNTAWGFTSESTGFGGITMPGELADWHQSIGYTNVENSTTLHFSPGVDHLLAASNYWKHGYRVCLFINDNMLEPATIASSSIIPNHWITLETRIDFPPGHKQFIAFQAWCWAALRRIPETGFIPAIILVRNYYGFVAARP
jgi:hypothetical protein